MKLVYNEEEFFCTRAKLWNFRITLPLDKLDMAGSSLVPNSLIFSDNIPVDIQLVTFSLASTISEINFGAKAKKFK